MTGRRPSRDPIEERGGINLYGFVVNDGVNWWDYLGLATTINGGHTTTTGDLGDQSSCPCKDNAPRETDDAGEECCPEVMEEVRLEIDDGIIGHAWLETANMSMGHYPDPKGSSNAGEYVNGPSSRPGATDGDSKRTPDRAKKYKACPGSREKLEDSMNDHNKDPFDLSNMGDRNCAGWACERLQDAGFGPPNAPDTPKLKPGWMK
jgi:hypothetical protein